MLCVDDDAAIVRLLTRWLGRCGFDAVGISDPMIAMEQLSNTRSSVHALITDQNMPGMTGLELARLAVAVRPGLPVFLATGRNDCLLPDELACSGVTYLVAKPVDLSGIVACLGETIGGPQVAGLSLV